MHHWLALYLICLLNVHNVYLHYYYYNHQSHFKYYQSIKLTHQKYYLTHFCWPKVMLVLKSMTTMTKMFAIFHVLRNMCYHCDLYYQYFAKICIAKFIWIHQLALPYWMHFACKTEKMMSVATTMTTTTKQKKQKNKLTESKHLIYHYYLRHNNHWTWKNNANFMANLMVVVIVIIILLIWW